MNANKTTPAAKSSKSPSPPRASVLRFGDCELHRGTHELWRDGRKQSARRQVIEVLLVLIDHRPRLVAHADIGEAVWGRTDVPHTRIARAVMEARRLIGDNPDAPDFLVSVRGVGYRFTGELEDMAYRPATAGAASGLAAAQSAIAQAEGAMLRGQYADAQYHVDRAIALADTAGANQEMARALALASSVVLRNGTYERAATLAAQALRYAELDGRGAAITQARLALADVHVLSGDLQAGLAHLEVAWRWLQSNDSPADTRRCAYLFSRAHVELDEYETASAWCQRAQEAALRQAPESRAVRERLMGVMVLLTQGMTAVRDGHHKVADDRHTRALEELDSIEPDAAAVGAEVWSINCLSYRGYALEALGRTEEAWSVCQRLGEAIGRHGPSRPAWLESREQELRTLRALLFSRMGRVDESLESIEEALLIAARTPLSSYNQIELHAVAATVCLRAGRHEQALECRNRQYKVQLAHQSARARLAASILRAELESDDVRQQLAQTQARLDQLLLENQSLRERLAQIERYPVQDDLGLVDKALQAAALQGRLVSARERELPFCLGVVDWIDHAEFSEALPPEALARLVKSLAMMVRSGHAEPPGLARWSGGRYVFPIDNLGHGRAQALCTMLEARLNEASWPVVSMGRRPRFSCTAVDAARHASLEEALTAVALPHPEAASHAAAVRPAARAS